ncbi:MAG: SpoIID/LytB domain-containing protein [Actinomycetota bacterium]|nr:SpoIID/LytB domain-containing protein [Actinomycetota bacterium]
MGRKRHGQITRFAVVAAVAMAWLALSLPAAAAEPTVTFVGGGFGHGLGMSQYGAFGMAAAGSSAEEIVHHYYTGVDLAQADVPAVRVGITQRRLFLTITSSPVQSGNGRVVLRIQGSRGRVAAGDSTDSWRIVPAAPYGVKLFKNGVPVLHRGSAVLGNDARPLVMKYEKFGTLVSVAEEGHSYALGKLEFESYSSSDCAGGRCLRAIATLAMQDYLYGISEMPSSWPIEALRAQVIASRTYAYRRIVHDGQHRSVCNCAVYDSSYDQVYSGDSKRVESGRYWTNWTSAVNSTNDLVILYGGQPIIASYHSSSGGHTENNENVWGGSPLPYLRGVPDPRDDNGANPNHDWVVKMPWSELTQRLNSAFGVGTVQSVQARNPLGVSGRVTVVKPNSTGGIRIVGTIKTVYVSGWSFRSAVGLKDTLFSISIDP